MYPTKQEILDEIDNNPPEETTIIITNIWKLKWYTKKWSTLNKNEKKEALEKLIKAIWSSYSDKPIEIIWDKNYWCINRETNIIHGSNISILSALHELGHAIYGDSELSACSYSIALFQLCFPKEYSRLSWDGHMLKKL